jgi:hypothetical protein
MRWQHPYQHVQADANFVQDPGYYVWYQTVDQVPVNSGLGPHQNREMNLMLAGLKPCAMIEPSRIHHWRNHPVAGDWHYAEIRHERNVYPRSTWAVALPQHSWRADRIVSVYRGADRRGHMVDMDHARIGYLLGYQKQDVRTFIKPELRKACQASWAAVTR